MIRPVDQARLLFLYLLRSSSAALAVVNKECGQIALRLARKSDIPMIQRCNLANLPENYSNHFYTTHMRQWPDLALVAEHIPSSSNNNHNNNNNNNQWSNGLNQQLYSPSGSGISSSSDVTPPSKEIIGYVLGKVEDTVIRPNKEPPRLSRSIVSNDEDEDLLSSAYMFPQQKTRYVRMGHVTSLAVMKPFRRRGVAAELMRQLHHHIQECYPSTSGVGLHVRVSNAAACRLYQKDMGYKIEQVIPGYYQDGEDAYFMKKDLRNNNNNNNNYPSESNQYNSAQQLSMYSSSPSSSSSSSSSKQNPASPYKYKNRLLRMRRAMSYYLTPWRGRTATNAHDSDNYLIDAVRSQNNDNNELWNSESPEFKLPRYLKQDDTDNEEDNDDVLINVKVKHLSKVAPTTTDLPTSKK